MEARDLKKLYYSISEVSEITDLKQYVLRYWESEFSQLKPTKNRSGNRNYRSHDIDLLLKIKSLLYDRKFTIKGAKQHLKTPAGKSQQATFSNKIITLSNSEDAQTLKKIKKSLDEVIVLLEDYKQ